MFNNPNKVKTVSFLFINIFFIWIILTELIFPGNQVFPSPSLVLFSYYDLFVNYNFLINLISTVSVIYISIFVSVFIVRIKFPFINYNSKTIKYLIQIPAFFLVVPEIMIAVLLIYWFGDSFLIKLIYAVFISAIIVYQTILKFDDKEIESQIVAAKSIGVSDQIIKSKIIWKFIEPKILNNFIDKHSFLWSTVIAFEFIQNFDGIGSVIRKALEFNDLSILISLVILFAIIVFWGEKFLRIINEKYFYWN